MSQSIENFNMPNRGLVCRLSKPHIEVSKLYGAKGLNFVTLNYDTILDGRMNYVFFFIKMCFA